MDQNAWIRWINSQVKQIAFKELLERRSHKVLNSKACLKHSPPPLPLQFLSYQVRMPTSNWQDRGRGERLAKAAHRSAVRRSGCQQVVNVPVVGLAHCMAPQHMDGFVQVVFHFVLLEGRKRGKGCETRVYHNHCGEVGRCMPTVEIQAPNQA